MKILNLDHIQLHVTVTRNETPYEGRLNAAWIGEGAGAEATCKLASLGVGGGTCRGLGKRS